MQHNFCPLCGSAEFLWDEDYGFYQCEQCHNLWGDEEADPDYDEEPLDLGACCACGKEDSRVRNLLMITRRTTIPGTGWGCVVCGIPNDGALVAVCDECVENHSPIRQAIHGYATSKERIPLEQLPPGKFDHDPAKHQGENLV